MKKKRIVWISGWSIPVESFERCVTDQFPNCEHVVLYPRESVFDAVIAANSDAVVGYSLGSLILLQHIDQLPQGVEKICLAPIFDFKKEAGLGSKVSKTQLKFIARWLKRDALAAIKDFQEKASLEVELKGALPYPLVDLQWGIETLLTVQVSPQVASKTKYIMGDTDPLLAAEKYLGQQLKLKIIPGAGHDFRALIQGVELFS